MAKRSARTTKKQFAMLIDYIEQNTILAQYNNIQPAELHQISSKWVELKNLLNSGNLGPSKTIQEWKKVRIKQYIQYFTIL